jgi:hypothetical protein
MQKSTRLTAVALLLSGCSGLMGPPRSEAPPEPLPAAAQPRVAEAQPQPARPTRAVPRQPQEVRIDNTSIESFRASWQRLHASLSPAQQADLNDAVVQLTFARYGGATGLPANLRNSPMVPEMIRQRLAGLSYTEILALSP